MFQQNGPTNWCISVCTCVDALQLPTYRTERGLLLNVFLIVLNNNSQNEPREGKGKFGSPSFMDSVIRPHKHTGLPNTRGALNPRRCIIAVKVRANVSFPRLPMCNDRSRALLGSSLRMLPVPFFTPSIAATPRAWSSIGLHSDTVVAFYCSTVIHQPTPTRKAESN